MTEEEREQVWDDAFIKEQGSIIEFDHDLETGEVRSIKDNEIYSIDSHELFRTRIELRPGAQSIFCSLRKP